MNRFAPILILLLGINSVYAQNDFVDDLISDPNISYVGQISLTSNPGAQPLELQASQQLGKTIYELVLSGKYTAYHVKEDKRMTKGEFNELFRERQDTIIKYNARTLEKEKEVVVNQTKPEDLSSFLFKCYLYFDKSTGELQATPTEILVRRSYFIGDEYVGAEALFRIDPGFSSKTIEQVSNMVWNIHGSNEINTEGKDLYYDRVKILYDDDLAEVILKSAYKLANRSFKPGGLEEFNESELNDWMNVTDTFVYFDPDTKEEKLNIFTSPLPAFALRSKFQLDFRLAFVAATNEFIVQDLFIIPFEKPEPRNKNEGQLLWVEIPVKLE